MYYHQKRRYIIHRRLGRIARNIRLDGLGVDWCKIKDYINLESGLTLYGINKLTLVMNHNKYLLCLAIKNRRGFDPVCFLFT